MEKAVIYSIKEQRKESIGRQIRRYTEYAAPNGIAAIDPAKSTIAVEILTNYSCGGTITEKAARLNTRGLQTTQGNGFIEDHRHTFLENRRYPGKYEYGDTVVRDAFEPIILPGQFEQAQNRLEINPKASACKRADEPFILAEKIFCGLCGTPMTGESADGQNGRYHYYRCSDNKRVKKCEKKTIHKRMIEDIVINSIIALLSGEEKLQEMADLIMEIQDKSGIENLLRREFGEAEISKRAGLPCDNKLSRDEVLCWLECVRGIDTSDIKQREMIVNLFVSAVYVFDDHIVINAVNLTHLHWRQLHHSQERTVYIRKVEGSIPFISANAPHNQYDYAVRCLLCFCFVSRA